MTPLRPRHTALLSPLLFGAALLLLTPAAASAEAVDAGAPGSAPLVQKEGKILVVRGLRGGEPQLTDKAGKRWLIAGPARAETLRLSGHVVRVWGRPAGKKLMTATLSVGRYEILDAGDGVKPLVGRLRRGAGGELHLEQASGSTRLVTGRGLRRKLNKRIGCKVWVKGKLQGDGAYRVSRSGLLTCDPPKSLPGPSGDKKGGAKKQAEGAKSGSGATTKGHACGCAKKKTKQDKQKK